MGLLVGIFLLPLSLQARNSLPEIFKLELGSAMEDRGTPRAWSLADG